MYNKIHMYEKNKINLIQKSSFHILATAFSEPPSPPLPNPNGSLFLVNT